MNEVMISKLIWEYEKRLSVSNKVLTANENNIIYIIYNNLDIFNI